MGNLMRDEGLERPLSQTYHFGCTTTGGHMVTFPEKLRQLREAAGLSQEALARAMGMSVGIVRDYEQGRKEPSMRSVFKLARALGVDCRAFEMEDAGPAEAAPAKKKGKRK